MFGKQLSSKLNVIFMILVLSLSLVGLRAQTADNLNYLNNDFAQKVWPDVQDMIKNHIIHQMFQQSEAQGFHLQLGQTSLDMSAPPGFQPTADGIQARFPASGSYRLRTVGEKSVLFITVSANVTVDIAIIANINGTNATFRPDVRIRVDTNLPGPLHAILDILGTLFGGPLGGAAVDGTIRFAEHIVNGNAEGNLLERIVDQFQKHLGMLQTLRYDDSMPIHYASPDLELIYGQMGLDPASAVDIVLVADGYRSDQMSTFDALAHDIANKLTQPDPANHVSEPYASFRSAFRIWKLNSVSDDPTNPAQRVLSSFNDPVTGTNKTSISNLARLAGLGVRARAVPADVLVMVNANMPSDTQANAFGNLILFPAGANAPTILVHELGHTILGRLADEYAEPSLQNVTYHGLEPMNANVSKAPIIGWLRWVTHPNLRQPWDTLVTGFNEGAYFFGHGVFRPSAQCKMRDAGAEIPFCPVCREALTTGIRQLLGDSVFVTVEYMEPWTEGPSPRNIPTSAANTSVPLQAFDGDRDTRLRLRLLAASLPEPWTVRWSVYPNAQTTSPVIISGNDVGPLAVRLGGRIVLELSSQSTYTPWDRLPAYRVEFPINAPRRPSGSPDPPTNLTQSVPVGSRIPLTYDPQTGLVRFSLMLSAQAGGFRQWSLPTQVEFSISGPGTTGYQSQPLSSGTRVTFSPDVLSPGQYRWQARSVYGNQVSNWVSLPTSSFHFTVLSPQFATSPVPPRIPTDLSVNPQAGGRFLLSATSWDMNGDRIRLEFEIKRRGARFDGQGLQSTVWLAPTLQSLRMTGSISVPREMHGGHWRVRAVDTTGLRSDWTDEQFIIIEDDGSGSSGRMRS